MIAPASRTAARIRQFLLEQEAIASLEFAFVLPVLLVMLLGMIDLGNAVTAHRATTAAAQTAADVVAQERQLSDAEVASVFVAIAEIISPADPAYASATLYSVYKDDVGDVSVVWAETYGPNPPATTTTQIPAGLLRPESSIIVASVMYEYPTAFGGLALPFFGEFFPGTLTMRQDSYLRPRRVLSIPRVAVDANDPDPVIPDGPE